MSLLAADEMPLSFFDFLRLINDGAAEELGEVTFPVIAAAVGDTLLTFFLVFFIARWVFDILVSLGKGGKR